MSRDWFDAIFADEIAKLKAAHGAEGYASGRYGEAADIFLATATGDELADFLTLPAYEVLRAAG